MSEKCNNMKFFWNTSCLSCVTVFEKHQCHKKNILSCPNITTCTVQLSIYLNFDKVLLGMETGSPNDFKKSSASGLGWAGLSKCNFGKRSYF